MVQVFPDQERRLTSFSSFEPMHRILEQVQMFEPSDTKIRLACAAYAFAAGQLHSSRQSLKYPAVTYTDKACIFFLTL